MRHLRKVELPLLECTIRGRVVLPECEVFFFKVEQRPRRHRDGNLLARGIIVRRIWDTIRLIQYRQPLSRLFGCLRKCAVAAREDDRAVCNPALLKRIASLLAAVC